MVGLAFDHAAQDQDLALGQLTRPGNAIFSRERGDPGALGIGDKGKVKGQWHSQIFDGFGGVVLLSFRNRLVEGDS